MKIEKDIELKKYNTYGVGGKAKHFVLAEGRQDLVDAFNFAKKENIRYLILGGGSNVLITDSGYNGLVVVNRAAEIERFGSDLTVSSGASLAKMTRYLGEEGLSGGEFLAGIPGTLGGAVLGNAGAWGKSISDIIKSIEFLDESGIKSIPREKIEFSYRNSSLKKMPGIILGATLTFTEDSPEKVREKVSEILGKRKGKHPAGRSCGSFFKNVEIADLSQDVAGKISQWEKGGKVAAGKLVEETGLKGLRIGGAEVSEIHANFLVNTGNATADDIKKLAEEVKKKVYDKFGVELEPEVRYI